MHSWPALGSRGLAPSHAGPQRPLPKRPSDGIKKPMPKEDGSVTTPRLFLRAANLSTGTVVLAEAQAHYLCRVLRLGPGARFVAVTGPEEEAEMEIVSSRQGQVIARVVQRRRVCSEPAHVLTVALAVLKSKAMDWAVQKVSELGAATIIPVRAQRVVVRGPEKDWEAKRARWQEIAVEAARQCGRTCPPTVQQPLTVPQLARLCEQDRNPWLLLDPAAADGKPLGAVVPGAQAVGLIVGPEGDFTSAEKELLRGAGAVPVRLGPRLLRAETAALAACALALYLLGDLE
jgi:16S rRNA (uracil1498-N3)-methyltransferase